MRTYNFEPPRYTYNDYKNWKEDWELVYGYPYQMTPSPSAGHSMALVSFITQGKNSLRYNKNCSCILFTELARATAFKKKCYISVNKKSFF